MTLPDNTALRALLDKATPGQWEYKFRRDEWTAGHTIEGQDVGVIVETYAGRGNADPDFDLMALAPELAAEVIRLREELTTYSEDARKLADRHDIRMEWEVADALFRVAYDLTQIRDGETSS